MRWPILLFLFPSVLVGCASDVKTTDDATQVQVDLPKVELGEQAIDLDPRTDGDIDIDTPLKGDK